MSMRNAGRWAILVLVMGTVLAGCGGGNQTLYTYMSDDLCASGSSHNLILVADSDFGFGAGEYAITQDRTSANSGLAVATTIWYAFGPGYPVYAGGRIVSWNPTGVSVLDSGTGTWWEPGFWDMSGSTEYPADLLGFKAEGENSRVCPDAPGSENIQVLVRDDGVEFTVADLRWTSDFTGTGRTGVEFNIDSDGLLWFKLFVPDRGSTIEDVYGAIWQVADANIGGETRTVLVLDTPAPDL